MRRGRPSSVARSRGSNNKPLKEVYLRLAVDEHLVARDGKYFTLGKQDPGNKRAMILVLDTPGLLRDHARGKELLVPLDGRNTLTIEYHWTSEP